MRNFFPGGGNGGNVGNNGFGGGFGNMMNMIGQFRQFMQNPVGNLMNSGMNIPQNIQNNPEAIVNYLRSSGQMSDDQFNQVSNMAQMVQGMFGNGR